MLSLGHGRFGRHETKKRGFPFGGGCSRRRGEGRKQVFYYVDDFDLMCMKKNMTRNFYFALVLKESFECSTDTQHSLTFFTSHQLPSDCQSKGNMNSACKDQT